LIRGGKSLPIFTEIHSKYEPLFFLRCPAAEGCSVFKYVRFTFFCIIYLGIKLGKSATSRNKNKDDHASLALALLREFETCIPKIPVVRLLFQTPNSLIIQCGLSLPMSPKARVLALIIVIPKLLCAVYHQLELPDACS
jgi:hypothetical protein